MLVSTVRSQICGFGLPHGDFFPRPKYCVMSFKDSGFCFGVTVIALCKQVQCLGAKWAMMTYTLRRQKRVSDE